MKKVVIVEDNISLSQGFKTVINGAVGFKVQNIYHNAEEALQHFRSDAPDIVLMDIELPKMNGVDATKAMKDIKPSLLVLVVTVYEDSKTVFDALCSGATGYLTKNASSNQIVEALEELISGGAPMSIKIARMVVDSFKKATRSILSDRETEVLNLLATGKSYKSIGEALFISRNTIKFHIKNIYEKLQVNSKEDALKKASDQRLI
ncbi:response regulator transcription factor [Winogradskyella tangerina]|uniref:response regulator transcription factor n=1 Tax=Winogradskyella tangerina TaxID=2023240 RepID=UPI001E63E027|nr:response regulator transcription factor [Winogradskyella tangerina]